MAEYADKHPRELTEQELDAFRKAFSTLDENGNFTQKNFDPGDRNKNGGIPQKIQYICSLEMNSVRKSVHLRILTSLLHCQFRCIYTSN